MTTFLEVRLVGQLNMTSWWLLRQDSPISRSSPAISIVTDQIGSLCGGHLAMTVSIFPSRPCRQNRQKHTQHFPDLNLVEGSQLLGDLQHLGNVYCWSNYKKHHPLHHPPSHWGALLNHLDFPPGIKEAWSLWFEENICNIAIHITVYIYTRIYIYTYIYNILYTFVCIYIYKYI